MVFRSIFSSCKGGPDVRVSSSTSSNTCLHVICGTGLNIDSSKTHTDKKWMSVDFPRNCWKTARKHHKKQEGSRTSRYKIKDIHITNPQPMTCPPRNKTFNFWGVSTTWTYQAGSEIKAKQVVLVVTGILERESPLEHYTFAKTWIKGKDLNCKWTQIFSSIWKRPEIALEDCLCTETTPNHLLRIGHAQVLPHLASTSAVRSSFSSFNNSSVLSLSKGDSSGS